MKPNHFGTSASTCLDCVVGVGILSGHISYLYGTSTLITAKNIKIQRLLALAILPFTVLCSDIVFAQCQVTGSTGEGGQVVECTGNDPDGVITTTLADDITVSPGAVVGSSSLAADAILPDAGNDVVRVLSATIRTNGASANDCINLDGAGIDTVIIENSVLDCAHGVQSQSATSGLNFTMTSGTITALDEAVDGSGFEDNIAVKGGTLSAADGVIQAGGGNDTITVTGGTLTQTTNADEVISGGSGNDVISISNAVIDGSLGDPNAAVAGNEGNDTIILGDGADIRGIIHGELFADVPGTDILVFEQTVHPQQIEPLCQQILAQGGDGSITINGLDYQWTEFDTVRCDLQAYVNAVPSIGVHGLALLMLLLVGLGLISIRHQIG